MTDPRARFDLVYAEVRRLCALPESALARLEAERFEVLDHNARWGLTRLPGVYRDEIDRRFVDQVIGLVAGEGGA